MVSSYVVSRLLCLLWNILWQTFCSPFGNSPEHIARPHDNLLPSDWHIRLQYALAGFSTCRIRWASDSRLACISTCCPLFFGYSWHYKVPKIRLQVLVNRFSTNTEVLLPRLLIECHQVRQKGIGNLILFCSEALLRRTGWLCRVHSFFLHQKLICIAIPRQSDLFPIVSQIAWWWILGLPDDLSPCYEPHLLFYAYIPWRWGNRVVSGYLFL